MQTHDLLVIKEVQGGALLAVSMGLITADNLQWEHVLPTCSHRRVTDASRTWRLWFESH